MIDLCKKIPEYYNNSKLTHWYDKLIKNITNYLKHESKVKNKNTRKPLNEFEERGIISGADIIKNKELKI
jgi:hypothetical protein